MARHGSAWGPVASTSPSSTKLSVQLRACATARQYFLTACSCFVDKPVGIYRHARSRFVDQSIDSEKAFRRLQAWLRRNLLRRHAGDEDVASRSQFPQEEEAVVGLLVDQNDTPSGSSANTASPNPPRTRPRLGAADDLRVCLISHVPPETYSARADLPLWLFFQFRCVCSSLAGRYARSSGRAFARRRRLSASGCFRSA
jgi:hypothetical protein